MTTFSFTTKHLLIMTCSLISGICLPMYPLQSILVITCTLRLFYQEKNLSLILLLGLCCFFLGITRCYQYKEIHFLHNHLLNKNCHATAIIQEILPRLDTQENICIIMQITTIQIEKKEYPVYKKVYLFLPFYTQIWLKPHQKIYIKNITFKHPNSESYQTYLIKEHIWAIAHQKKLLYTTISKPSLFMQQLDQLSNYSFHLAEKKLSEKAYALYISIFYGKKCKSQTTTHIKKLFQYWGISHHLARSGLHLVILITILLFLCSWIPYSQLTKQWIILGFLSFYYVLTFSSIAFMRAFYMYVLYTICKQCNLATNPIHILLITTFFILTINPYHLFFLDFQLSFSITMLILCFTQIIQNRQTIASL